MGLVVFLLAILTSSDGLVSISWLHVGDLASEIRIPAVSSDREGGYEVPSSASLSIVTSYLRHIFLQRAGCCSSCSVVQNSSLGLVWRIWTPHLGLWIWRGKSLSPRCRSAKGEHLIPWVGIAFRNGSWSWKYKRLLEKLLSWGKTLRSHWAERLFDFVLCLNSLHEQKLLQHDTSPS